MITDVTIAEQLNVRKQPGLSESEVQAEFNRINLRFTPKTNHFLEMMYKYRLAARYPWFPVEPDPNEF